VRSASVDAEAQGRRSSAADRAGDDYQAAFQALAERRVDSFLADELLLLRFAQRSGSPQDSCCWTINVCARPRLRGEKNEPRLMEAVNRTPVDLEASGEAAKIFDAWFAPTGAALPFRARLILHRGDSHAPKWNGRASGANQGVEDFCRLARGFEVEQVRLTASIRRGSFFFTPKPAVRGRT